MGAEPFLPRQLQYVGFNSNNQIEGDLSDLKGLTRLRWKPSDQKGLVPKKCGK